VAKERLRKQFLERRREMTFEDVWAKSAVIQKKLVESPFFKNARNIALYSSIQNEVLTDDIFTSARQSGKTVCYPRVFGDAVEMEFLPVGSLDELSPGAFDIREPVPVKEEKSGKSGHEASGVIDPGELDLIVIPGVAFDITGGRLGFGKGFYDRALSGTRCPFVAMAYEFQIMDFIPTESFDVRMDSIITEKRSIKTPER